MFYSGTLFRSKSDAIESHAAVTGHGTVVDVPMVSAVEPAAIDNAAAALQRFLDSGNLIKNLPDQKSPRTITARPARAASPHDAEHDFYMDHASLCM